MRSIVSRSWSLAATLLLLVAFAGPSKAGLVLTLAPGPGIDLANVHVGDTLHFFTIGSSNVSPDEFLTSFNVHLFSSGTGDFDSFSAVAVAGWNNPLGTNPAIVDWSFRASAAGTIELFNGFSDCLGLPADTTGCAITNLGATRPDDSNHITFNILEVPEPSSIALLAVSLLALRVSSSRRKS